MSCVKHPSTLKLLTKCAQLCMLRWAYTCTYCIYTLTLLHVNVGFGDAGEECYRMSCILWTRVSKLWPLMPQDATVSKDAPLQSKGRYHEVTGTGSSLTWLVSLRKRRSGHSYTQIEATWGHRERQTQTKQKGPRRSQLCRHFQLGLKASRAVGE